MPGERFGQGAGSRKRGLKTENGVLRLGMGAREAEKGGRRLMK